MSKLRKFLRGCFGYAALAHGVASFHALSALFTSFGFERHGVVPKALAIFLLILSRLIVAIPIPLTVLFGFTWWALKAGKTYARRWAIASSIALLLSGINFAIVTYWMSAGRYKNILAIFPILAAVFLAAGIAGLIAFRRDISQADDEADIPRIRIRGDGTHKALDALALILQVGGTLKLISIYTRWGHENDLPPASGLQFWMQWVVALVAVTVIHESAHASVGVALGMKLRAFVVGPFQWRVLEGRWTFKFRPTQILAFSGAAGLTPTDPDQNRWSEVAMVAAGPISNLFTGAVAGALAYSAEFQPWEPYWELFALFASISLVVGVVNLIPFRPDAWYSDGARIYQLLRGGPVADYHRAVKSVLATIVTPRRPKDYDIAAIQRASSHFTDGHEALMLRLFANSHYFDRGRYTESSAALADAERIYHESASDISAELHLAFVIKGVFLRRDAAAVRQWWDRMEIKKVTTFNQDYWLAKSALAWAENDPIGANEAWNTGKAYLEKLPDAGTYNFDRDCYVFMKNLLDGLPNAPAIPMQDLPVIKSSSLEQIPDPSIEQIVTGS